MLGQSPSCPLPDTPKEVERDAGCCCSCLVAALLSPLPPPVAAAAAAAAMAGLAEHSTSDPSIRSLGSRANSPLTPALPPPLLLLLLLLLLPMLAHSPHCSACSAPSAAEAAAAAAATSNGSPAAASALRWEAAETATSLVVGRDQPWQQQQQLLQSWAAAVAAATHCCHLLALMQVLMMAVLLRWQQQAAPCQAPLCATPPTARLSSALPPHRQQLHPQAAAFVAAAPAAAAAGCLLLHLQLWRAYQVHRLPDLLRPRLRCCWSLATAQTRCHPPGTPKAGQGQTLPAHPSSAARGWLGCCCCRCCCVHGWWRWQQLDVIQHQPLHLQQHVGQRSAAAQNCGQQHCLYTPQQQALHRLCQLQAPPLQQFCSCEPPRVTLMQYSRCRLNQPHRPRLQR
ncbi:hypothetical protein COO60DRAFT_929797 [Scenedesmus sp. NREL 46B-D3]|nr:hypothetical protein COO60DRAFT_929797 [Scenedesmus sp. NREL 46B-D3]